MLPGLRPFIKKVYLKLEGATKRNNTSEILHFYKEVESSQNHTRFFSDISEKK